MISAACVNSLSILLIVTLPSQPENIHMTSRIYRYNIITQCHRSPMPPATPWQRTHNTTSIVETRQRRTDKYERRTDKYERPATQRLLPHVVNAWTNFPTNAVTDPISHRRRHRRRHRHHQCSKRRKPPLNDRTTSVLQEHPTAKCSFSKQGSDDVNREPCGALLRSSCPPGLPSGDLNQRTPPASSTPTTVMPTENRHHRRHQHRHHC